VIPKSWKTTVGGILGAIGSVMVMLPWPIVVKIGGVLNTIAIAMIGVTARDNDVPSSAVPKAADRDAAIKGDTATITKP